MATHATAIQLQTDQLVPEISNDQTCVMISFFLFFSLAQPQAAELNLIHKPGSMQTTCWSFIFSASELPGRRTNQCHQIQVHLEFFPAFKGQASPSSYFAGQHRHLAPDLPCSTVI